MFLKHKIEIIPVTVGLQTHNVSHGLVKVLSIISMILIMSDPKDVASLHNNTTGSEKKLYFKLCIYLCAKIV
jgi:hypothetical protein